LNTTRHDRLRLLHQRAQDRTESMLAAVADQRAEQARKPHAIEKILALSMASSAPCQQTPDSMSL
jgi:hypothetical protein